MTQVIGLNVPWEKAELLATKVEMDQWTMCAKLELWFSEITPHS